MLVVIVLVALWFRRRQTRTTEATLSEMSEEFSKRKLEMEGRDPRFLEAELVGSAAADISFVHELQGEDPSYKEPELGGGDPRYQESELKGSDLRDEEPEINDKVARQGGQPVSDGPDIEEDRGQYA